MRKTIFLLLFIILIISVEAALPAGWTQTNANTVKDNSGRAYTKNDNGFYARSDAQYTYFYNPASNQQLVIQNTDSTAVKIITYSGSDKGTYTFASGDKKFMEQENVYVANKPSGVEGVQSTGGQPATAQEPPKISGIINPESIAGVGPAGSTPQPGEVPANKFYYVAGADTILPDGTKLVKGQALILDQDVSGNDVYDNLKKINLDQYKFAQTNVGHYKYAVDDKQVVSFTTVRQTQADNAFENYRTTTTVTITQDEQGNTHRRYDEQTTICGKGFARCNEEYKPVPGSRITVDDSYTSVTKPTAADQKGPPETRSALTERTTILYSTDSEGNSLARGTMTIQYMPSDSTNPFSTRTPQEITIWGSNGVLYYHATIDPNTLESNMDRNQIDLIPGLSRAEKDGIRRQLVETGALGFGDAVKTLTFWQNAGTFIRAYYEFAGLRQLTSMIWPGYDAEVQARKERIQQQFCLAAGITNCVTSTICGTIYDISSDNVLAGRGPGGQYVSSAALNAERSLPIEVEGMTRQQLIDLFGNATVIKGVWINLTDPKFDPKILGRMKLRLYHVQFSVTNNIEGDKDLHYNIVFKKVPQGLNSSYGIPVAQARWWSADQNATRLETKRDDIYKFSGTEYSDVCLTFDPSLPSGHAALSSFVDKLCVPFAEYAGGATDYLANPQAGQETPEATSTTSTPGALV